MALSKLSATPSVAQVDAHVFAAAEKLGIKNLNKANLKAFNLCQIYTTARPILKFVVAILFFKPSWQAIATALMASLDAECGITPGS
jgi:hypothetical protein